MERTWKHLKALIMGPEFELHDLWDRLIAEIVTKAQYIIRTVTGLPPLSLLKAISVTDLKVFGTHSKHKAEALWGRWVPCDGITNASSTSIDTGIKAQDNIELFIRVKGVADSFYILQARESSGGKIYGISGSQTGNTITSFGVTSDIARTAGHIYTIKATLSNGSVTLYVNDETTGEEDTKTGTVTASAYPLPSPTTIKLYGDYSKLPAAATVYRAYIKVNGEMAWDMYPAVDVTDSNAPVAYDDISHKASTVVSGSVTGGELIQPITYAESTGTQYFDLEHTFEDSTKIEFTMTKTGANQGYTDTESRGNVWFGANGSTGSELMLGWGNSGTANYFRGIGTGVFGNWKPSLDTKYHIEFTYEKGNGQLYVDGEKKGTTVTGTNSTDGRSILIGAVRDNGATTIYCKEKFHNEIKMWNGDTLLVHYIPVRVGTTVELLDLVSWSFATRTGTFTAGADIPYAQLCTEIIRVNTGDLAYGQYGKNIFDRPDGSYSSSEKGSISVSNQVIAVNYQWSSAWSIYKLSGAVNSDSISASITQMKSQSGTDVLFKAGKTYIVKLFGSTTDYYDLQISSAATNTQIRDGVAFTPTEDFNALWVRTQETSQTAGNHTFKVMIVEGSTVPTEYEPYHFGLHTDGSHKLTVRGKNLAKGSFYTIGVTSSKAHSPVELQGNTWITDGRSRGVAKIIEVEEGKQYTVSMKNTSVIGSKVYSQYASIEDMEDHTKCLSSSNTIVSGAKYALIGFWGYPTPEAGQTVVMEEFQIEEGSTATEYEPYIQPISRDIPTLLSEDSVINVQDGAVSEAWKVVVLDGTESWSLYTSTGHPCPYMTISDAAETTSSSDFGLCSHAEYKNTVWANDNIGFSWSTMKRFFLRHEIGESLADFKAWLAAEYAAGHPVLVLYPLATPAQSTASIVPISIPAEGDYTAITDPATKMAITYLSSDVSASNGVMTVRRIRPTATIEGGVMTL